MHASRCANARRTKPIRSGCACCATRPTSTSEPKNADHVCRCVRASARPGGGRNRVITLALTPGEPAGIGPDIAVKLLARRLPARIVVVADIDLLAQRARALGIPGQLAPWASALEPRADTLEVLHVPLRAAVTPGKLDVRNSAYVIETLERAADGCLAGTFNGMVTGPVHKGIINAAGIAFTGHTEMLAERTRTARVVMMLCGGGLRIALATTHLALRDVPGQLDAASLEQTLRILVHDLAWRYALERPRIGVAGLNPHAGESGYLGREEIEIIVPVVERLKSEGYAIEGPLPADTLFIPARLRRFDAVLAMYHDQGLPVLKYASFGHGINVTLGLPIVRTSVDHGTALDVAGSLAADESSLIEAIAAAAVMAQNARAAGRPLGAPSPSARSPRG
ncbi:MAG: 4-hydroxythreonine-4-phosphate dehydrogenase PdxA [Burkholderiales bacterium]|nr:4-hydroxythreonine-4-phosphate dehydrogenase PdxA [Burkholderiales bacterium]